MTITFNDDVMYIQFSEETVVRSEEVSKGAIVLDYDFVGNVRGVEIPSVQAFWGIKDNSEFLKNMTGANLFQIIRLKTTLHNFFRMEQ